MSLEDQVNAVSDSLDELGFGSFFTEVHSDRMPDYPGGWDDWFEWWATCLACGDQIHSDNGDSDAAHAHRADCPLPVTNVRDHAPTPENIALLRSKVNGDA